MRRLLAITALLAVGVAAGCGSDEADQPATTEAAPSNAVVAPASPPTPGSLEESRSDHTATILDDGRVLVVGGFSDSFEAMASVEVFDPKTGAWTAAASLKEARSQHGAAKLHDGRVLVMGGLGENLKPLGSAEVYDPATGTWTPAPALAAKRYGHTVTMLSDGGVLVVAGQGSTGNVRASESFQDDVNLSGGLSSAELYDIRYVSPDSRQYARTPPQPHSDPSSGRIGPRRRWP